MGGPSVGPPVFLPMIITRKRITAPAIDPVGLDDEAKVQCGVDDAERDGYIQNLIARATSYVETITGRALISQKWDLYPCAFPYASCIELPLGRLLSLDGFEYTDTAGVARTWTVLAGNLRDSALVTRAHIDLISEPAKLELAYGQIWPTEILKTSNPIKITGTFGYGTAAADVQPELRQALLLLIDHWFRHREAVMIGEFGAITSAKVELAFESLIAPFRIYQI